MRNALKRDLNEFAGRHIGPSPADTKAMLDLSEAKSLDELMEQTIPSAIRQQQPLEFGPALSEREALLKIRRLGAKNKVAHCLIGQGYYGTILPTVIQRNILENPAWYTAYTPYQPEISQGRLEALLNFQTVISDLTGLEIANASLLDEATAAAEAMAMARRISKSQANAFFVDNDCHPQTIAVVRTRAEPLGIQIVVGDAVHDMAAAEAFGAILQYPGSCGAVRDLRPSIEHLRKGGAVVAVAADPLALTLLSPPGEIGADIAVGSTQRFGVPMGYGGPHAAYIATKSVHQRLLPGRLVGVSVDARGRPAYRLALQTREQHIRREKATSNICTAQVLLAIIASMYAVYHGPDGLRRIAANVHRRAVMLAAGLRKLGWTVEQQHFFDTFTVDAGDRQSEIIERAAAQGVNLRVITEHGKPDRIGMSCDEVTTPEVIESVWRAFGGFDGENHGELHCGEVETAEPKLPDALRRQSTFLTHSVFHSHRSETEMLRYIRRLSDYDLALDRTMIPLGSCTMKLNATTEMIPLSWPEFSDLHPFAPLEQAEGYRELAADLEQKLCTISGYDAVSLQPNSGAQGEYAGLLCIRAFHHSNGQAHRDVCLIPASAHGTNPASAQMAGMTVIVVNCDANGNIDLKDLDAKAERHAKRLAVIMVTYPSTHGVFEEEIRQIAEIVHKRNGQVYLDGANLNAQVGLARPGDYGADVSHFNLHKTFCIPHGGGGPGMGPIGVKSHLAPFLPAHPLHRPREFQVGAVSAAPLGSASILTISWIYMALMGGHGLTQATKFAILNANYIAARLKPYYKLLFQGRSGRVAHECILDTRPFKDSAGISVEDMAKRLIDYGFHAPTISFPVPGTLMIEPTESEAKAELDRFCDAMIHIRKEIGAIETGKWPRENNPLKNAPHTAADLVDEKWGRPYSRAEASFPIASLHVGKYWSPVNRIDNAHGDRTLVCTCPALTEYQEAV